MLLLLAGAGVIGVTIVRSRQRLAVDQGATDLTTQNP
jgi:hypothetical protein